LSTETTVLGRVLFVAQGGRSFAVTVGAVRLGFEADPSVTAGLVPGDWVEVRRSPEAPHWAATARVLRSPTRQPFPPLDSDWYRFHARGAEVYRNIERRAALLRAIRAFFHAQEFLEAETPAIATCPGLELHLDAVGVDVALGFGGSNERRWLVTSPEYHMKRLLAVGFPRIYQLARAFRSGEAGAHHNPEFTMLEWYRAGASWQHIAADFEELVGACAEALDAPWPLRVAGKCPLDLRAPWQRLTVAEAVERALGFNPRPWGDAERLWRMASQAGVEVGATPQSDSVAVLSRILVDHVEPSLPQDRPVILHDFPAFAASLAALVPEDTDVAQRFEIYAGGMELANGFTELTCPVEQRQRLQSDVESRAARGLPAYPIDERFLAALDVGLPPCAGVAVGVDRLLMLLSQATDIQSVLAFPIDRA
jgi:lysyl-tRNA synthetase class 2